MRFHCATFCGFLVVGHEYQNIQYGVSDWWLGLLIGAELCVLRDLLVHVVEAYKVSVTVKVGSNFTTHSAKMKIHYK